MAGWLRDMSRYGRLGARVLGRSGREQGEDFDPGAYRAARQALLDRLHPRRMKLRVTEIIDETTSSRTLRVRRTDGEQPVFLAGQYLNVFVEVRGIRTSRPYSVSSAPARPFIDLTIRRTPDGFVSRYLTEEVSPGLTLETSGPAGHFHHEPLIDGDDLVFLAGGSGITPFMGMIRQAELDGWPQRIHLLYGSRSPEDVIFHDELQELAGATDRFRFDLVISEPAAGWTGRTGLLDAACIRELVGDPAGRMHYACGPSALLDLAASALAELSVPGRRLRRELYGPPPDISRDPAWPEGLAPDRVVKVTVDGGEAFTTTTGEPLLWSLEKAGRVVPAICRSGQCSACRTRLVSGRVMVPQGVHVREADVRHGFIHPCMSFPLEDLELRLP